MNTNRMERGRLGKLRKMQGDDGKVRGLCEGGVEEEMKTNKNKGKTWRAVID
jgi:hypothetical protein